MVGLGFFQQLCSLDRALAGNDGTNRDGNNVGMDHMWKIALRANSTGKFRYLKLLILQVEYIFYSKKAKT